MIVCARILRLLAVTMILTNRQNQSAKRALRIRVQEVNASDRGDRSQIVFDQPRDVAGAARTDPPSADLGGGP